MAFVEITIKKRTRDGKVWWPKEILNELWGLWDDRPKERGRLVFFHDKYSQTIGRLRRGVTGQYVKDELLFNLIEKFVEKHSEKGEFILKADDIVLIQDTALTLFKFAYLNMINMKDHQILVHPFVRYLKDEFDILNAPITPREKYIITLGLSDIRNNGFAANQARTDPVFMNEKFLAVQVCTERRVWPIVLFESEKAYIEIGFFIVDAAVAFLRSARPFFMQDTSLIKSSHHGGNMRILDAQTSVHSNSDIILFERNSIEIPHYLETEEKERSNQYSFERVEDGRLYDFSHKILNFLDLGDGFKYV